MVGNSFQMIGAATEKANLPRFSFVLGIESCWEVDDPSLAAFTASIGCWLFITVYLSCYFLYKEGLHNNLVIYQHCIFSESSTCV